MGSHTRKFIPPTREWQKQMSKKLDISLEYYMRYGGSKYYSDKLGPTLTASIRPDGNCFFRALSVIISGVEDNHLKVREHITSHVSEKPEVYRTFLQSRGGMDTYVRSMRRSREWATDTEILAAATFLNTIIEVCSVTKSRDGSDYQWQSFAPLNDPNNSRLPRVYICHRYEHFEPILDVAEYAPRR